MKCSECPDWEAVNKNGKVNFGICKREGKPIEKATTVAELRGFYQEEITRHGDKTRPWHSCDKNIRLEKREVAAKKTAEEKKGWSTKDTLTAALSEIRDAGVPIPRTIDEGFDKEDIFPKANTLSDKDLSNALFKYGALRGYVRWLLFTVRVEYNNVRHARAVLQGEAVHNLEVEAEKKRLKEGLEAVAIKGSEKLTRLVKKEIQLEAKMDGFQTLLDIYQGHWETVSREISKRDSEIKAGLRQANLS